MTCTSILYSWCITSGSLVSLSTDRVLFLVTGQRKLTFSRCKMGGNIESVCPICKLRGLHLSDIQAYSWRTN